MVTPWPAHPLEDTRTPAEWTAFCAQPFDVITGCTQYAAELAKITVSHVNHMKRKNLKGVSAYQIMKNGASPEHFEALFNCSRLLAHLGKKGSRLGTGTTRNEQLHRELKSWTRNIYQSHRRRLLNGFRIFVMVKLLTHSSAAYSPTLTQTRQRRLLSLIASKISQGRFYSPKCALLSVAGDQKSLEDAKLQTVHRHIDTSCALARKKKRQTNKSNWAKRKMPSKSAKISLTDIFKRPRMKKLIG